MTRKEQKLCAYILVVLSAIAAYWAILRSPLLFLDDAVRVYTHMSIDQGIHGRPFADLAYMLLSNGLFVDFSPLTQILALMAMAWAGMHLHDCFLKDKITLVANSAFLPLYVVVLSFVLFPLHFSFISYRFDALSFGLAILCAVLAFVTASRSPLSAFSPRTAIYSIGIPGVLLSLSLSLYQAMFGIFICCALFFLAHGILRKENLSILRRKSFSFLCICCLSSFLYIPIYINAKYNAQLDFYGIGPHPHVNNHIGIGEFAKLPWIVVHNIQIFSQKILSYMGYDIPSIIIVILSLIFVAVVGTRKISTLRKIAVLLLTMCAFAACAGLQLFLSTPLFIARTSASLCAFVTCLFLLVLAHTDQAVMKKSVICLAAIFALSAACILSAIGNAQRDQYHYEKEIVFHGLAADLMMLHTNQCLKSFYVTPIETPACTTLKTLKRTYGFLKDTGSMTFTFFTATKMMAYLPVNYMLKEHFRPAGDLTQLESVITRPNYSIKKIDVEKYVVVLHPFTVEPFTPERYE